MRSLSVVLALSALIACRSRARPPGAEADPDPELQQGARDGGPPAACALRSRASVLSGSGADAGSAQSPIEATRVVATRGHSGLAWVDRRSGRVVVRADARHAERSWSLGAGERSDPAFALLGDGRPAVAWVRDAPGARTHVVRLGARIERGCVQAETRDEGLSIAAVATPRGLLVAWDEDGPRPAAGSVKVQLVTEATVRESPRDESLPACPTPRTVSAAAQDASDPVLIATPEGGALLLWSTARDVDATQANDTVTDLWAQALSPDGASLGGALRLTTSTAHRFGVAAAAGDASSAWVAFRVSDESDSESRGDGGDVIAVRVERDARGLTRASDPITVTAPWINPSGAPAVFARGERAQVFVRHRSGPSVTTVARTLRATGSTVVASPLREEPLLGGEVPHAIDPAGYLLVAEGHANGALSLLRLRCDARR